MRHSCDMELASLVCSCSSVLRGSSPWLCGAPQRALLCCCVSGPQAPQPPGPQGEGMADLMMYRKSEDQRGDPGAAIGRRCALEARPTVNSSPVQKGMWKHSMWTHSESVCTETCSVLLHSWLFYFSSHLCRGQGGLSETRQRAEGLKLSARSFIPSRLMGN